MPKHLNKNKPTVKTYLFLLLCAVLPCTLCAEKYALLTGVGNYPADSGWTKISAANDLRHLTAALQRNGFAEENITLLLDEKARKADILRAFDILQSKLQIGDIVYLHFSAHGQQLPDLNGDEIDGLDEAVVPYDSPKYYRAGSYTGENLLTDDELSVQTGRLCAAVGEAGQVVLVLDSCHSGTGSRGKTGSRGTDVIMGAAGEKRVDETAAAEYSVGIYDEQKSADLSALFCYYSSGADELNYETADADLQPVGSLSYAVAFVLSNHTESMTHAEFFEKVKLKMKTLVQRQNPQREGRENRLLFGENSGRDLPYYAIAEYIDERTVKAEAGSLGGVYPGSSVELYSVEERRAVQTGRVVQSDLLHSIIRTETALRRRPDDLLRVRVTKKALPPAVVKVRADIPAGSSRHDALVADIFQQSYVRKSVCNADLYLEVDKEDGNLRLSDAYGTLLLKCNTGDCREAIKNYAQGSYLKELNTEHQNYDLVLRILSADCHRPHRAVDTARILQQNKLPVGTCIQAAVTNRGSRGAYFSLLDIQPDNQTNLLIPGPGNYAAADFYLAPGQTYLTDYVLEIGAPTGEEVLKLIAADRPLRLREIMQREGKNMRSVLQSGTFNSLFYTTYITGAADAEIFLDGTAVTSYFLRITK